MKTLIGGDQADQQTLQQVSDTKPVHQETQQKVERIVGQQILGNTPNHPQSTMGNATAWVMVDSGEPYLTMVAIERC